MRASASIFLASGSIAAAIAVGLGAVGSHYLRARLDASGLAIFQRALEYHFIHALGLLIVGVLAMRADAPRQLVWSGVALLSGIVLFCGSLYLLTLWSVSAARWFTPVGGMCFIAGWLMLAVAAVRLR